MKNNRGLFCRFSLYIESIRIWLLYIYCLTTTFFFALPLLFVVIAYYPKYVYKHMIKNVPFFIASKIYRIPLDFFSFFSCSIRPHHLFCSENFLTTIHRKQIVLFFLCCCCLFWFRPFHKNPNPKINWINRDTEWNKKHART